MRQLSCIMMTTTPPVQLVWFKRDLRLEDHAPLYLASQQGPCIFLYVFEPEMMQQPDFSAIHGRFILESLKVLAQQIRLLGGKLLVLTGTITQVLTLIHQQVPFTTVWSHQETGNWATYQRDIAVGSWLKAKGIAWEEVPQTGVIRKLKTRDGWAEQWQHRMNQPLYPIPTALRSPVLDMAILPLATHSNLGFGQLEPNRTMQKGGSVIALKTLQTFLTHRGGTYRQHMSSPVTGEHACSRLSPYLAWGNISVKQVYQATKQQEQYLKTLPNTPYRKQWLQSLQSFEKRLYWHCHFMQKLESQPSLEFENMNRAFDGLRETTPNPVLFEAWKQGKTGYPFVDACMRYLIQTGWLNFRMRAMLVSFATHYLWLHWQQPAHYLATLFLDYEPGIHYPQFQMQSGVTGINATRIYSPYKQSADQDPTGSFIAQYVPELAHIPAPYIHQPALLPPLLADTLNFQLGRDYPFPIVDNHQAYQLAKERLFTWKQKPTVKATAKRVLEQHGSRNRTNTGRTKHGKRTKKGTVPEEQCLQQQLPFSQESVDRDD